MNQGDETPQSCKQVLGQAKISHQHALTEEGDEKERGEGRLPSPLVWW
jgi:hypothetical protein